MKIASKKNPLILCLLLQLSTILSMELEDGKQESYEELQKLRYDLSVVRQERDSLLEKLNKAYQKNYCTPEKAIIEMHQLTLQSSYLNDATGYCEEMLLFAVKKDYQELLKALYSYVSQNSWFSPAKSDDVKSAFLTAAANNNLNAVKFFIEKGVDIDTTNVFKETSLMVASCYNNYDITSYLLEQGADTEKVSKNGRTALAFAILNNKIDIVSLLLSGKKCIKKNPDNAAHEKVNKANPNGYPPEKNFPTIFNWLCAQKDKTHILENFINAGVIINPNNINKHPLLDAINSENIIALSILLKYRANPHFLTTKKVNPHYLVLDKANPDMLKTLMEKSSFKNKSQKQTLCNNLLEYAHALFSKEIDSSKKIKIEEIINYLEEYLTKNSTRPVWEEMEIENKQSCF